MPRLPWRRPTMRNLRQQTPDDSLIYPPGRFGHITTDRWAARNSQLAENTACEGEPPAAKQRLFRRIRPPVMKRPALKNFRRIVVKVGSSLLIDSGKGEVRASWLAA